MSVHYNTVLMAADVMESHVKVCTHYKYYLNTLKFKQGILNGITQQLWKGTVDISITHALLVPSPMCLPKEY